MTLTKATLDDAYSVFKLNTTVSGGTTTYADGSEPGTNPAPQLRRPAAATTGGPPKTDFAKGAFSCDKPSTSDDIKVAFDFSNVSYDVAIDASQPYARVVATVSPKLTITYTAEAAQSCTLNADAFSYRIPVPVAGVPLQIVVHPTVTIDASAKLTASATLTPTLTAGIAVLGNTADHIGSLTASATASIDGKVTVDAFLGVTAAIALPGGGEGTAGLKLTGGPRAQVELTDQGCTTVSAGVKAYGEVFVSTLVNKWQATLATYQPDLQPVYKNCGGGTPTPSSCTNPGKPDDGTLSTSPPLSIATFPYAVIGVPYDETWTVDKLAGCGPWIPVKPGNPNSDNLFVSRYEPGDFGLAVTPVYNADGSYKGVRVFGTPVSPPGGFGFTPNVPDEFTYGLQKLTYTPPSIGDRFRTAGCWGVTRIANESFKSQYAKTCADKMNPIPAQP